MTDVAAPARRWDLTRHEIAPGRIALRRLGGGRDYEVYVAWDELRCGAVAAKMVRPDRLTAPGARRRLENEADLLAELAHPNLPRFLGRALDADVPHVVMEYLDAPPLKRVIQKQGSVDLDEVVPLAVHIARAVHYLAAMGYVHLDVKPGNVVMGAVPTLIDLSLARTRSAALDLRAPVGTPAYLSPEQCLASTGAMVTSAADVWGIGITLYEAVEGERPFPTLPWKEVESASYPQVREEPRPMQRPVPEAVRSVVMDCLARDPARRPAPSEIVERLDHGIAAAPRRLGQG